MIDRGLFTTGELVFAVVLTALAGVAALALGHGSYQTPVIVEIAMVAGFVSIVRTRYAEANGRRLLAWSQWSPVGWSGLAAIGLLLAPNLT